MTDLSLIELKDILSDIEQAEANDTLPTLSSKWANPSTGKVRYYLADDLKLALQGFTENKAARSKSSPWMVKEGYLNGKPLSNGQSQKMVDGTLSTKIWVEDGKVAGKGLDPFLTNILEALS